MVQAQGNSLIKCGVGVDFFPIHGKGTRGYFPAIGKLRKHLHQNRYDLIHAHYGLSGNVALLANGRKIPLIVSYMGDDLLGEHRSGGRISPGSEIYVLLNRWQARHRNSWTIVKSKQMLQVIKGLSNASVIPNGVDFEIFRPVERQQARNLVGLERNLKYILFPADPERSEKNFPLADRAVQLVKQDRPDINLLTVFNKEQPELNLYYNAADLILLTSYHEGSPNTIKEAMACNCPIVSTKVGDVREVLDDTKGCYIASLEPEDVRDRIIEALNFRGRTNGRAKVEHLRSDHISNRLIKIYNQVIR